MYFVSIFIHLSHISHTYLIYPINIHVYTYYIGAGLAGYKMARRTKDLKEFKFEKHSSDQRLSVIIMISGMC